MKFYNKQSLIQAVRHSGVKPEKIWYNDNGSSIVFEDGEEDGLVLAWILKNQDKLRQDKANLGPTEVSQIIAKIHGKEKQPKTPKAKKVQV